MNSLEKLNEVLTGTGDLVPEDEEQAKLMQMLQMAAPFIGQLIPETAEEFDAVLLGLTRWTIDLRSDDAEPRPATEALAQAFGAIRARAEAAGLVPIEGAADASA